jgi:hypothetical protein
MPDKTPEQIAADEAAATEAERIEAARQANKTANEQRLARLNGIADHADEEKEQDELVPLTDEEWDQKDRPDNARRKTRAELIAEQDQEEEERDAGLTEEQKEQRAAARLILKGEQQDREMDELRDLGVEDVRESDAGEREYQIKTTDGKTVWLSAEKIREAAARSAEPEGGLPEGKQERKTATSQGPTPEQRAQARREAEARQAAETAAYKSKLKDLYTRASMGDEAAIDELAEIQSAASRVTPDLLRIVDERVDSRVQGRTDFEKAVDWFESEYATELATTRLKTYAARRDMALAAEHPDMPARERLKLVGDELRDLRKDLGGAEPVRKTPIQTKVARKQALPNVRQASGRPQSEPEADEVQSTSDAIANMAKSRGQARPIKH